jgi:hypothetical protein
MPAPGRIPVCIGIEVEDVRSGFTHRVGMGRHAATRRGVMPMEVQRHGRLREQATEIRLIARAFKLTDVFTPRFSEIDPVVIFKHVTVVRLLIVLALHAETRVEQGYIRQRRQQCRITITGEELFRAYPRKRLLRLIGSLVDVLKSVKIDVLHGLRVSWIAGGGRRGCTVTQTAATNQTGVGTAVPSESRECRVTLIVTAFAPRAAEIELSGRIIATYAKAEGRSAVLVDGKLIENLRVQGAHQMVAISEVIAAMSSSA